MVLQIQRKIEQSGKKVQKNTKFNENDFTKDYVEFLNEAGWILEKKLPSSINHYSDLLEDTEWKSQNKSNKSSKHYRRDLDALS